MQIKSEFSEFILLKEIEKFNQLYLSWIIKKYLLIF
jgi:hypothetical protein